MVFETLESLYFISCSTLEIKGCPKLTHISQQFIFTKKIILCKKPTIKPGCYNSFNTCTCLQLLHYHSMVPNTFY